MTATVRTVRYVRTWLSEEAELETREVVLDRDGTPMPTTVLRPAGATAPLPAWIALHGMTRPGRSHAQLLRFARALASTGRVVVVPEVPEWVRLELAPAATVPTVRATLDALPQLDGVAPAPAGLIGFSFGAPQAIAASGHPSIRDRLAGVVAFGGYVDLERTIRFLLTGWHEHGGRSYHHQPDPYGRWIVGANYLTAVPGLEEMDDVAAALRHLAEVAGDLGIKSWDSGLQPLKEELRARFQGERRRIFGLFCPEAAWDQHNPEAVDLAVALTAAGRERDPDIDPVSRFESVRGPVRVLHGRNDHLIPFTEACRMRHALPSDVDCRVTVTRLFGHSEQDPFPWRDGPRESVVFLRALRELLALV